MINSWGKFALPPPTYPSFVAVLFVNSLHCLMPPQLAI